VGFGLLLYSFFNHLLLCAQDFATGKLGFLVLGAVLGLTKADDHGKYQFKRITLAFALLKIYQTKSAMSRENLKKKLL